MNEKTFYTYMLLDPRKSLEPFYVGKGLHGRARIHLTKNNGHNPFCQRVINRIRMTGQEPIIEEYTMLSEQAAFDKEKELIAKYGRRDNKTGCLTNLTDGGEGSTGYTHTDETKSQCAVAGRKNKGKKHTEEQKKYQSSIMTSPEVRSKISESRIGWKALEKTKKKQSESLIEYYKNRPSHLRKVTDIQIQQIKNDSRSLRIIGKDYGIGKSTVWRIKNT